jgi:hypothetical protein
LTSGTALAEGTEEEDVTAQVHDVAARLRQVEATLASQQNRSDH